ncbi:MAG: hypothetical protein ACKVQR_23840, partial [Aquabacterium sp.]
AAACGDALPSPQVVTMTADGVQAAAAVRDGRFVVGRPLPVLVQLCGAEPVTLLRFDADMPAHRHGMNYRPTIKALQPGIWEVQGVLLHMPGSWRLIVEVQRGNQQQRLTQVLEVP